MQKDDASLLPKEEYFPERILAQYDLLSCIHQNNTSSSTLAQSKESRQRVVIKHSQDPVGIRLLQNEYDILQYIWSSHQNSSAAEMFSFPYDLIIEGNHVWFIRSYIHGMSLEDVCETAFDQPGIPPEKALDIMLHVCEKVCFLHSLNPPVIHRDIKPQNILVDSLGDCHLIDFGISRLHQEGKSKKDTQVLGTRAIAPPEQFGYRQTDERSDIYCLGVVLYYCLTGDYDLTGLKNEVADPGLVPIIEKATQFDPDRRYQSAKELLRVLIEQRFSACLQKAGPQESMTNARKRTLFQNPLLLLLTAAVFFAGGSFYQKWSKEDTALSKTQTGETAATPSMDSSVTQVPESDPLLFAASYITQTSEAAANESPAISTFTFREPLLETAVRAALQKPEGELSWQDLCNVTSIHLYGMQPCDSEEDLLFYGTNPQSLTLSDEDAPLYRQPGTIKSLEDLWLLPNLEELNLYNQQIEDLSVFAQGVCPKLTKLGLGNNPVKDYSPLSSRERLTYLNLDEIQKAYSDLQQE